MRLDGRGVDEEQTSDWDQRLRVHNCLAAADAAVLLRLHPPWDCWRRPTQPAVNLEGGGGVAERTASCLPPAAVDWGAKWAPDWRGNAQPGMGVFGGFGSMVRR